MQVHDFTEIKHSTKIFSIRFTKITFFGLRGLCDGLEKIIDTEFAVDMNAADSKNGLVFTGVYKSILTLNKKTNRWNVVLVKDGSIILELDVEVSKIVKKKV